MPCPKGTRVKKILRPSGEGKRTSHIACQRRLGRASLPPFEGGYARGGSRAVSENSPRYKSTAIRSCSEGPSGLDVRTGPNLLRCVSEMEHLCEDEGRNMKTPLCRRLDAARSQRVLHLDDHVHGVRVEAGRLNGNLARLARARGA